MPIPGLRVAAARNILGLLAVEEAVQVAHELLDRGIYSFTLGKLIFLRHPYPLKGDVEQMFGVALKELGVAIPASKKVAAGTLIESYVLPIAEESCRPLDSLLRFRNDLQSIFWDDPSRKIIEDYRGSKELMSWSYSYDDYEYLASEGLQGEEQLSDMD